MRKMEDIILKNNDILEELSKISDSFFKELEKLHECDLAAH